MKNASFGYLHVWKKWGEKLVCQKKVVPLPSQTRVILTKNHKYCRLSIRSCDNLQLFLYLCDQNMTNESTALFHVLDVVNECKDIN